MPSNRKRVNIDLALTLGLVGGASFFMQNGLISESPVYQ